MPAQLALFAGVALLAIATPGPTVLLALNNGARWGVRAALPGIAGAVLSDAVLMAAAALGAAALLAGSALAFAVLKWLGVAYLCWLGWRLLRAPALPAGQGGCRVHACAAPRPPARRVLWRSFAVAVGNPKGYLFVSALLPQFVLPTQPAGPQWLQLALVFGAIDATVLLAYAALGAHGQRALPDAARRWLDRVCGATLCGLAASLALARRPA